MDAFRLVNKGIFSAKFPSIAVKSKYISKESVSCISSKWNLSLKKLILPAFLVISLLAVFVSGCAPASTPVPADLAFTLDARSTGVQHVNIQINANGKGRYERYDTGGVIEQDENGMAVYDRNQIIEKGNFRLTDEQLSQLWQVINGNHFFQLTDDYRISIGHAYAFIQIEANDQKHRVDNFGMVVPEIKAIVETINSMLPKGVVLDYGDGLTALDGAIPGIHK